MSLQAKAILAGVLTVIGVPSVGVLPLRAALIAQAESAEQKPKRILILYDENKDELPGLARTDRSLREVFRERLEKVEIHNESMGLSRSGRTGFDSLAAEYYRSKYAAGAAQRPDECP